jgi:hypothetical protein
LKKKVNFVAKICFFVKKNLFFFKILMLSIKYIYLFSFKIDCFLKILIILYFEIFPSKSNKKEVNLINNFFFFAKKIKFM